MALTRHSVRTCFLWQDRGDDLGRGTRAHALWRPFLECLLDLQDPEPIPDCTAPRDRSLVEGSVKRFLTYYLAAANNPVAAADLRPKLGELPAVAVLEAWFRKDHEGAPKRLFVEPRDRGAAAFYLGEIAFLFGQLRLAKDYAVEAYGFLQQTAVPGHHREAGEKPLSLRMLEFLTVTLLIEVAFHSEGYDTFRDHKGRPQARRIYVELNDDKADYVEGFPRLDEIESAVASAAKERNGKGLPAGNESAGEYVRRFWLPIPTDNDIEALSLESSQLGAFSLTYVLSRRNRAGMLQFRYQEWREAEEEFSAVVSSLDAARHTGRWGPMLTPIEHEALLYLGRIEAQFCDFAAAAKKIDAAETYFAAIGDEFAQNKAHKARAELWFRQYRWPEAERLFTEIIEESRAKGFAHDQASAEMYRGKILSRFGFQSDAEALFAGANDHFRRYAVPRESVECLFWQIATHARRLDLRGHPERDVIHARALMQVYRKLFAAVGPDASVNSENLIRLGEALSDKRHPGVSEVMLDLRLGVIPSHSRISALEKLVKRPPAGPSGPLQARLGKQLLRLVCLQQVEDPPAVEHNGQQAVTGSHDERRLRKFTIRDQVLSALEGVAKPHRKDGLAPVCLALQQAYRGAADHGLGGGLVPFLVDLSQYFVERDSFVVLLLLMLEAVDGAIRAPAPPPKKKSMLDPTTLKEVYRSLTKYLVLERNFYVAPPAFNSGKRSKLWAELKKLHPGRDWAAAYRSAQKGEHGLSYPTLAVALGWVEGVDSSGASLRLLWVEECLGRELRLEDFRRIDVPLAVVRQGHADRRMAPVVLIGRHGETGDAGTSRRPWTAHRVPIELPLENLFVELDEAPWYLPDLAGWSKLFRRFTGQDAAVISTPKVSKGAVARAYDALARLWFGDRLSPAEFRRVFKIRLKARGVGSESDVQSPSRTEPWKAVNQVFTDFPTLIIPPGHASSHGSLPPPG